MSTTKYRCLRIGELRHLFEIRNPTADTNALGTYLPDYSEVAGTVWGSLQPIAIADQYWAQQVRVRASHRIFARYSPLINSRTRLILGSRSFEVANYTDVDGRKRMLLIFAFELEPEAAT